MRKLTFKESEPLSSSEAAATLVRFIRRSSGSDEIGGAIVACSSCILNVFVLSHVRFVHTAPVPMSSSAFAVSSSSVGSMQGEQNTDTCCFYWWLAATVFVCVLAVRGVCARLASVETIKFFLHSALTAYAVFAGLDEIGRGCGWFSWTSTARVWEGCDMRVSSHVANFCSAELGYSVAGLVLHASGNDRSTTTATTGATSTTTKAVRWWLMLCHHALASFLLCIALSFHVERGAFLTLLTHSPSDVLINAGLCTRTRVRKAVSNVLAVAFAASWFFFRTLVFPFWVFPSVAFDAVKCFRLIENGDWIYASVVVGLLLLVLYDVYFACAIVQFLIRQFASSHPDATERRSHHQA